MMYTSHPANIILTINVNIKCTDVLTVQSAILNETLVYKNILTKYHTVLTTNSNNISINLPNNI